MALTALSGWYTLFSFNADHSRRIFLVYSHSLAMPVESGRTGRIGEQVPVPVEFFGGFFGCDPKNSEIQHLAGCDAPLRSQKFERES